jgi:Leucine-rich repeat (LRR) protein
LEEAPGQVPDEVFSLAHMETLIIADNDLTSVPDAIGTLTQLRTLDLGHNALTELAGVDRVAR